ncbi:MAG: hypothetical protein F4024_12345 [Gammaproteobacteria bacterium]|nr:hypothetical protein [Gammaproteobacteria bacterium]
MIGRLGKKTLIASLLLNVVLIVGVGIGVLVVQGTIDEVTQNLFDRRADAFAASKTENPDLLFLGDSITHEGSWPEYFPGLTAINRGIGGDTIQHLLDRFDKIAPLNPGKLFLMIGINNLNSGHTTDEIIPLYGTLFDRFDREMPGTHIYVQSVLPTNSQWMFSIDLKDVATLNAFLETEAAVRGYRFISLDSVFADSTGQLHTDLSNDGIHIAGDGYRVWSEFIDKYAREQLAQN